MQRPLNITLLGPAHPYRGGLAAIMHTMARLFQRDGHRVDLKTFTVQYPAFLFPGESQYTADPAPADLRIERCVNTVNPFNWIRLGCRIRREAPDLVLLKYWTPFMAPCFGTVARIARRNGHTKFICQIDNVEPHERRPFDRMLNRWFLSAVDGFVYMSEQVHRELRSYTSAPALFSPHPLFEHYGEPTDRRTACERLGLDPARRYALFFGLVRDYKGLDWLLEAWARLRREKRIDPAWQLIVAGEFYTDREPYLKRLAADDLRGSVVLRDRFIPDGEVGDYFSAAEFLVLPYKSATQSGVTQIAYQFRLPVVVTRVGGLAEIVFDGRTGYVCDPDPDALAAAVERMADPAVQALFRRNMEEERKRFSWEEMCRRLLELYARVEKAG